MYKVQSVIINKNFLNRKQADEWVKKHFKIKKRVDETLNYFRYRQLEPDQLIKNNYNKIITKSINDYIKLILYYK